MKYYLFSSIRIFAFVIYIFNYSQLQANNSHYINLSNFVARKHHAAVISNNVANINTVGYEASNPLFHQANLNPDANINNGLSERKNSFVTIANLYSNGRLGGLRNTGRSTDIAIAGEGYFKINTPYGMRYTLDGAMIVNQNNILVNRLGYPYMSENNAPIAVDEQFQSIEITQDGAIYVDQEIIDIIGVFDFANRNIDLIKDDDGLYRTEGDDFLRDNQEYQILSGVLRESNVDSMTAAMEMKEAVLNTEMSNNMLIQVTNMDKSVMNKLFK